MAGDYLSDYDRDLWGDAVTFDELAQMVGQLVIVNDSWYPEDELEEDGEGDVLLVTDADGDVVHLRGDTPKIYEITRQDMDDSVKCRHCTKVWKVKGSEAADMIEETKSTVIVSGDYTRAVALTRSIIANAQAAQQSLYEVCKGLKEMRDGKLYKELGYSNFEEYTENEVGIKRAHAYRYMSIAESLTEEFVSSMRQIGTTKLSLLAKLDEPTREAVQETVDMESVTVKELKAQIAKLEADKEAKTKQFQAAMESKDAEISEVRSGWKRRSDTLIEKIGTLQQRITELEERPVEHDVVDNTEELEAMRQERDAANAALTEAQKQLAERPMVQTAFPGDGGERRRGEYAAISNAVANALDDLMDFLEDNDHCSDFRFFACRAKEKLREYNSKLNDMLVKEETSCQ
jgi:DNA repair exonuclease SbcCD ATPase subunit